MATYGNPEIEFMSAHIADITIILLNDFISEIYISLCLIEASDLFYLIIIRGKTPLLP